MKNLSQKVESFFWISSERFLDSQQKDFGRVSKLHSMCPEDHFCCLKAVNVVGHEERSVHTGQFLVMTQRNCNLPFVICPFLPESLKLLASQAQNTASVQRLSRERSPVGSRFPESLFLDVPGTATEQVRTCGFRRNSSGLDRAPKIRDSVRLNSFEILLVTLPSISSETWEMYSWVDSKSSVLCALLFLVLSGISLETASSFFLFPNVAVRLRKKIISDEDWIWALFL